MISDVCLLEKKFLWRFSAAVYNKFYIVFILGKVCYFRRQFKAKQSSFIFFSKRQLLAFSVVIFCRYAMTLSTQAIYNLSSVTYVKGGQSLADALLNEVVCDATGGMFVENRVHQGDLGSAAPRLGLGGTELSNSEEDLT